MDPDASLLFRQIGELECFVAWLLILILAFNHLQVVSLVSLKESMVTKLAFVDDHFLPELARAFKLMVRK